MSQKRIDRSGNESEFVRLSNIDANFDDLFDIMTVMDAPYTFAATIAPHNLFNVSPNGALNIPVGLFEFECMFGVTGMSTSSGSLGFALGGSATIESQKWFAFGRLGSETNPTGPGASYNSAAQTTLISAGTNGNGWSWIRGIFRVSARGTLIPQVSFTTITGGPICTVEKNSFFRVKKLSQVFTQTLIAPPTPLPSSDTPFWS